MLSAPAARARLADQAGFTIVELLAASVIGVIVIFAVYSMLDVSILVASRNADRLGAIDRGRVAMDQIAQQISSQICLGTQVPAMIDATDNELQFYASLAPPSASRLVVQRRRLTYRPATHDIYEELWTGTGMVPTVTFPAVVTRARVLVGGVQPVAGTPVFAYYGFDADPVAPSLRFTAPLAADQLARTVRIEIAFQAVGAAAGVSTELRDQVYVRTADPTDPERSPKCL